MFFSVRYPRPTPFFPLELPAPLFPALELPAAANSPAKDGTARNFPNSSKSPLVAVLLCTRQFASPLRRRAQQSGHTRTRLYPSRVALSPRRFPLPPPPANPWPPKLLRRLPRLFPVPRQCPAALPIPDASSARPLVFDTSRVPPNRLTPN